MSQPPAYHLAPNFSISPAPKGPIELGSIVKNIINYEVLNDECRREITTKIYDHQKRGFSASRSKLREGEYGIWAQILGNQGIGTELSISLGQDEEVSYRFEAEDTTYFSPTMEYMKASMNEDDVVEWVRTSDYAPVYMITGLKIARGPSVNIKRGAKREFVGQLGVQQPGGLPIEVGPKANNSSEAKTEESWDDSDDFIVGLRVKKLVFKKAWWLFWSNKRGDLEASDDTKGASLLDAGALDDEEGDEIIEISCEEEVEGMHQVKELEEGEEVCWLVPNSAIA